MFYSTARLLFRLFVPAGVGALVVAGMIVGCKSTPKAAAPGQILPREGDEIVVCGQLVHTGTPVVLWMDPGGYDAYRVDRRFAPIEIADWDTTKKQNKGMSGPARYNIRREGLTDEQFDQVRGGGWDLPLLQTKIDQFVLHYDQAGISRMCFNILQDHRGLSVHFMLDLDGTIYQTLDVKERAPGTRRSPMTGRSGLRSRTSARTRGKRPACSISGIAKHPTAACGCCCHRRPGCRACGLPISSHTPRGRTASPATCRAASISSTT